jgi:hypothetical protein
MKRASLFVVLGLLAVAVGLPAMADDGGPIQGYIAGGYSQPMGSADDKVDGGWNLSGGMIFNPNPSKPFGLRIDLGFNDWDANQSTINDANSVGDGLGYVDGGYATIWSLTADALWHFGKPDHVGGYIGLGVGGYRRYAALTNYVTQVGYICDPWWGCYYAPYTGSQTVAHDTLTKFGYNASIGMTFPVGNGEMYLEARYHYMITDPATEYIPVLLGYRF